MLWGFESLPGNLKFLLTSSGITNPSIAKVLFELVGTRASETAVAFVPTAANVEEGDKGWLVDDLCNIKKQGLKRLDIVDISALPREVWQLRLEAADVLFFSGGNTFHLMIWLKKSGLAKLLPDLLKTRVYVGISAGSMVTSKNLALSQSRRLYYSKLKGDYSEEGLGFFNFYVWPHLNSPDFPNVKREFLEKIAKELKDSMYALDDQSALKIDNNKIEVVSEGDYFVLNQS